MTFEKDFDFTTIFQEPDYDGEVIATLISSKNNLGKRQSILYIHGYTDYFFQPILAEKFNANGYDFHALDLRKHGRSMLKNQKPNYCENVSEFFDDITEAIKLIKTTQASEIFLLGHSNGGLISSHYMNFGEERDAIKGLILNAPFLNFPMSKLVNNINYFGAKVITKFVPKFHITEGVSPAYPMGLHKKYHGEWEFDEKMKPIKGFPVYFKWAIAITDAQKKLKSSSNIKVPILVLYSSDSFVAKKYKPEIMEADIVLNVKDIEDIAPKLGNNIQMTEIKHAIHDVYLSKKEVREKAFEETFSWLKKIS